MFANYLAYKKDNNELLLFILRQLSSDHLSFNRNRYGGDVDIVEVPEEEFVEKVSCTYICLGDLSLILGLLYHYRLGKSIFTVCQPFTRVKCSKRTNFCMTSPES